MSTTRLLPLNNCCTAPARFLRLHLWLRRGKWCTPAPNQTTASSGTHWAETPWRPRRRWWMRPGSPWSPPRSASSWRRAADTWSPCWGSWLSCTPSSPSSASLDTTVSRQEADTWCSYNLYLQIVSLNPRNNWFNIIRILTFFVWLLCMSVAVCVSVCVCVCVCVFRYRWWSLSVKRRWPGSWNLTAFTSQNNHLRMTSRDSGTDW